MKVSSAKTFQLKPFVEVELLLSSLDRLLPMHAQTDGRGVICHMGPTLQKVCGDLCGKPLVDVLRIERPEGQADIAGLPSLLNRRLHVVVPAADGGAQSLCATVERCGSDGYLIDFAFGKTVLESVQRHALSMSDFAPCDPTMDMLFVIEANEMANVWDF